LVQPIVFPGGPVASTQERDRLLRKKVEERNLQHLIPKKRTRINTQAKNNNSNLDGVLPAVKNRKTPSVKKVNNSSLKKKRNKKDQDASSSSSSSSSSSGSSSGDDNSRSKSEVDSDDNLSENELDYDMSGVSEYYWLIGKAHMDDDDKKMYVTTRVEVDRNGFVVAYRQLANAFGKPVGKESKNSYHVADIIEYTKKSTHLLSASTSNSSSSSSPSQPSSAEAISNSLKCEIIGCNEDQYDVCAIGCKKMLCAKHINLHGQERSCHATTVKIYGIIF
jgi:hypothetical protein